MFCFLLSDQETHTKELIEAQIVPAHISSAQALGFNIMPIDFKGVPFQHIRRMAGNSFNQGCFVAWQAFMLTKLQRRQNHDHALDHDHDDDGDIWLSADRE